MMRKFISLAVGIMMATTAFSQKVTVIENFDGNTVSSYTSTPANGWAKNSNYFVSAPYSYRAKVPHLLGDSIVLATTQPHDFSNYDYIQLRFNHICKVSPSDKVILQYRVSGQVWQEIPAYAYLGEADNYASAGFNATSYSDWQPNDSTVTPAQSWWKSEVFDMSPHVNRTAGVQFRFILKRGNTPGTQISYGWLLDDIEVAASTNVIANPVVEFLSPMVKDTVYNTGPWEINAKIESTSTALLKQPWLKYTATQNGILVANDSVPMTMVGGNSQWKANIPQFLEETMVFYSITGEDMTGNYSTISSAYIIIHRREGNPSGYAIMGTGNVTKWETPVNMFYEYGWTRFLYLASELGDMSQSGGIITTLSWDFAGTQAINKRTQKCYFRAVDDDVITSTAWENPVAAGGELVWSGNFVTNTVTTGWIEITLDQPFVLPPGKNLLVYWHNESNTYWGGGYSDYFWNHTTMGKMMAVYQYDMNSFSGATGKAGRTSIDRPNLRLHFEGEPNFDTAVAIYSIDLKDTMTLLEGSALPVVVTIKNKGNNPLTSATIYYSINGGTAQPYYWTGNLTWDFILRDTIGYYTPKFNGKDTITIWVEMPNGITDVITEDDTLSKVVYSAADIFMTFVNFPATTVNNTGPFSISAHIYTGSGTAVGDVSLNIETTRNGTSIYDTLQMTFDAAANLYRCTIPQTLLGSDVSCSIDLEDIFGNWVSIERSFHINQSSGGNTSSVALVAINTPEQGGVMVGTAVPIHVTIRNKGASVLDSCVLSWSLNGQLMSSMTYYCSLSEDFTDTLTVDYYTPVFGQRDTLDVKVSMPNGEIDPVRNDDSLRVVVYGCQNALSGQYTVGEGGYFSSVANAFLSMRDCGVNGDLILQLKGIYTDNIDLTAVVPYLNGHHLTIASLDNDADSVIIRPSSGSGIRLGNNSNITLRAITIDVTSGNRYGIQFTAACTNIVIRDCKILANPTTTNTASAAIYKADGIGIADNIFIINNILDGGYYGFYFCGGNSSTSSYGTYLTFDSNKMSNQYNSGIYLYWTDLTSCSYNTVKSRTANTLATWHGLHMRYNKGDVIGNRIIQRTQAITNPTGIYSWNHNPGTVANNEIILYSESTSTTRGENAGISSNFAYAKLLHNSIYISGTNSSKARGIESTEQGGFNDIKNNNIVMTSLSAYPIYIQYEYYAEFCDADNNNMYAPTYVGYVGADMATLAAWRNKVITDQNSISVQPNYINPDTSLQLTNYTPLYTSPMQDIQDDIEKRGRINPTALGCYSGIPSCNVNAALLGISRVNYGAVDTVKAVFVNFGSTPITAATLNWTFNGAGQSAVSWAGNLSAGAMETIVLGSVNSSDGDYEASAWIVNLGSQQDEYSGDDTINVSGFFCSAPLSGTYTVGVNGYFSSLLEVFDNFAVCGVSDNVVLEMKTGTYSPIDLSNISSLMNNYTLTITSEAHDATQVSFALNSGVTNGTVVTLSNTNNVVLKDITIDATEGTANNTFAVQFMSACTNIVIRDCKLLTGKLTAARTIMPIYKASSTGIVDSIFIINNTIVGGDYGIRLYAGTSYTIHGKNIFIDSNTIENVYTGGMFLSYTDFMSCSYNRISNATPNSNSFYGIRVAESRGKDMIGNRINQRNAAATSCGLHFSYLNENLPVNQTLIANNEIIITTTTINGGGIILSSLSRANIFHNSIYVYGSSSNDIRGISITTNNNHLLAIKNNNIVMANTSRTAYPIYINNTNNLHLIDLDNNNMYASQYVGYVGSNKTTIADWQTSITSDHNSIRVNPVFVNDTHSLQLVDYSAFYTTPLGEVTNDITGSPRLGNSTALGCYHGVVAYDVNASLSGLYNWREYLVYGMQDTIKTILYNLGNTPLTTANISWSHQGTTQTVSWSGNLALGEADTIVLGVITYSASGNYTLSAWINNLGGLVDEALANDTVTASGFVCPLSMSGVYTIGQGEDFPDLFKALEILTLCGANVNGDIVFEIKSGTYNNQNVNLSNISSILGNNQLTITSVAHDATSVTLVTNSVGFILSNSNNIVIKDITIDATAGTYAVQFTGACSNVVIRDCRLLANPTSTPTSSTTAAIHKAQNTGILNDVRIINNELDGGYSGFYCYGGTNESYGQRIVFDSNTVTNPYNSGVYPYYVDFASCSDNIILSRSANTTNAWNGIYMQYCNGNITKNTIRQQSNNINNPYGIRLRYYHSNNTTDTGLIANNVIILNTTGTYSGIYADINTKAKILHNSIYVRGTSGSARGIQIVHNALNCIAVKNNNIVMASPNAYPIYLNSTTNMDLYDMDYNNMYAQTYAGYAGSNKTTIAAWQQTVTSDQHSVAIQPSFVDNTQHLKLTDYTGLECPVLPLVKRDAEDTIRTGGITAMGAYHGYAPLTGNAALINVLNWREGAVFGQTDTISVALYNTGSTPLTAATIAWTFNNVGMSSATWTGSLDYGQETIVKLGGITYTTGENTLQAWIDNLNVTDLYPHDDTITITGNVCAPMSNVYTIGTSLSNYTNIADALAQLKLCGADADVIFEIQSGTYNQNIDLSGISTACLGNNTLTITSVAHDATMVTLTTNMNNAGMTLSNSSNIIIKDITIDATAGRYAVQFVGACSNIVIQDCRLLANPTSTSNTTAVVHKAQNTGIVDDIRIFNNELDGGYYGFYFYGGTTGQYGTHIVFDSNTVSNQSNCGMYTYYADFTSCSYNAVQSRTANTSTTWQGLRLYNSNGLVSSNRIIQRSTAITQPSGMYFYDYSHYNTFDTGLVVNNEIILNAAGAYDGIYMKRSLSKVLHNSIYVSGTGAARGIYLADSTDDFYDIKNNNIVMTSSNAYPVYLASITSLNRYDIDNNNMYAPTYVGYAGSAKATIQNWQQTITTDQHSVSVLPAFVDPASSLELSSSDNLLYRVLPDVPVDINNTARLLWTTAGAYTQQPIAQDAMLLEITPWTKGFITNQQLSVNVELLNLCDAASVTTATLGWSVNGVSKPNVVWNASPALQPYEVQNVHVGSFAASNADTFRVAVWIESFNGQTNPIKWNDTVFALTSVISLAEFAEPFVPDTIIDLLFTVNAFIREETGAPASTPQLILHTTVNGLTELYDTIDMVKNGEVWQATTPPQYYGSTVVYSVNVSDLGGNSIVLTDSTYIHYLTLGDDTLRIVGTGTNVGFSPYFPEYNKGWSRSVYMDRELNSSKQGGYITQIAYDRSTSGSSVVNNLSMYFKAISDSIITQATYVDPVTDGATLVWGKGTKTIPIQNTGWVVFDLHTPFYLPPNANLMVYWNNEDGNYADNGGNVYWRYTTAPNKNILAYSNASTFPTTENISVNERRPNAQFMIFGSTAKYLGHNLGIQAITDPVNRNINGGSCSGEYVPLKIVLINTGEQDYDFSVNNVTLDVAVSNAIDYTIAKTLTTGMLLSGETDTIEIDPAFPVYMPGQYDIKVWLTSPVDNIVYDDTIESVYMSERLGLPISDNFSGSISSEFVVQAVNAPAIWTVVPQGTGSDTIVKPVYGTGMLAFTGSRGAMSRLATRQLEFRGTALPALEFWYFHDTVEVDDYMDVLITTDGGTTYTILQSVLKQDADYGWKKYTVDLVPYIGGQCLNILFEVMQMSPNITQYIDSINITAKQDIAIKEVLTPELSACDMQNKAWRVVLENLANPIIDYAKNPTKVTLEITGTSDRYEKSLNSGALMGFALDTITLDPNMDFAAGTYNVRVYFTSALDENPLNDTLKTNVVIKPDMNIQVQNVSTLNTPVHAGLKYNQEVIVTNTGNLELPNVKLIMKALDGSGFTDTVSVGHSLLPNSSTTVVFNKEYSAPWLTPYQVEVHAYLECDSAMLNRTASVQEYVNMTDLYIIEVTNPVDSTVDHFGDAINVSLRIQNRNPGNSYNEGDAKAGILIKDESGNLISSVALEDLPSIEGGAEITYTFNSPYTVPTQTRYLLMVYITSDDDEYPENDTAKNPRKTDYVGTSNRNAVSFSMEQNVPNPAKESTIINYSVPQDGEIVFHVYSVSGQLLYTKQEDVSFGSHRIELNLSDYAAGIYFYTMQYNGQRLVKRMSIKR
jgi:hypothetical protein